MSYSVRKSTSDKGWNIVETHGLARKVVRKFAYRHEARDWLKAFKENRIDIDGEPKQDTSIWRNAETPIADNH